MMINVSIMNEGVEVELPSGAKMFIPYSAINAVVLSQDKNQVSINDQKGTLVWLNQNKSTLFLDGEPASPEVIFEAIVEQINNVE